MPPGFIADSGYAHDSGEPWLKVTDSFEMPVTAQFFRLELDQATSTGLHVFELDGFGENGSLRPVRIDNSLFDAAHGSLEASNFVFADGGMSAGGETVDVVQWRTQDAVMISGYQVGLLADSAAGPRSGDPQLAISPLAPNNTVAQQRNRTSSVSPTARIGGRMDTRSGSPRLKKLCPGMAAACTLLLGGCSGSEQAAKYKEPRANDKSPRIEVIPGDSAERRTADDIALKKKATDLLNRITDEKSADSLVPELNALIKERGQLDARIKPHSKTSLPQEEEAAIKAKYGKDLKETTLRYIEALKQFERPTQKKHLTVFLEKTHGIDITRLRMVKK